MVHLWIRAEQRANEDRTGLTPEGAQILLAQGFEVTVERSANRIIPDLEFENAGCEMASAQSWPGAPHDAIIFGLKELPDDGTPLPHRHIMFGHAFKGQFAGQRLLQRFDAGGGALLDLEYLLDDSGRRLAAFGYWAGYAGAAVSLLAWAAQQQGGICPPVSVWRNKTDLLDILRSTLDQTGANRSVRAIIIGAKGRVGTGACDLCEALGCAVTGWDMKETAHGGPFPEILTHDVFLNCILAGPETPVFVPKDSLEASRTLSVIGDIACDPDSAYNPIPLYKQATDWAAPVLRVHENTVLDVMAIDNLPSLLPLESSQDFAAQLLPVLSGLAEENDAVWARAEDTFRHHINALRQE
ncbi:MAG: saccharopine dehydrogenase [Pseudomonadota bacterium]